MQIQVGSCNHEPPPRFARSATTMQIQVGSCNHEPPPRFARSATTMQIQVGSCNHEPPPNPLRAFGRPPVATLPATPFELFASAFACSSCACSWTCLPADSVEGPLAFVVCACATLGGAICLPRYIPVASSRRCGRREFPLSLSFTALTPASA